MPRASDMRYQWAVVVIALVDHEEMQELVLDAWGMCVPKKLFAAKFTELDQSESRLR